MTDGGNVPTGTRVLALYEAGRRGSAAFDVASGLVERESAALTVLAIAPRAPGTPCSGCCGADPRAYNQALAEATADDLRTAYVRLGPSAERATFKMLVEGTDPPLVEWISAQQFELVLLPARRRVFGGATHPEAARVQACTTAEVRVIDAE
jgi:hypothetical protein